MDKTKEKLIKEILKNNPQVDLNKLMEGRALAGKLKQTIRRRGYRLALPMSGKRAYILDEDNCDHRTVRLHQS